METKPVSNELSAAPFAAHKEVSTGQNAGSGFGKVLGAAVSVAGTLASTVAGASSLGIGPLAGSLAGTLNGGSGSDFGNQSFQDLLLQQEQIQKESAVFTSLSNISKTEHETRMSAIRNMRAG